MRMKKLGKLMVLGSIIGTMLSVNAAFASGLDSKHASDPNFFAAYHEGKEIPFDDKVAVYGGGDMYYPDMTYCDNNMIAAREGKTKFEYDKRGFLLATGFADAAEKDMEARAKVNYVHDNKLDLKNIDLSADGFIEFSGGYLGHWASGEQYNNEIVIENSTIETTNKSSVGIYMVFFREMVMVLQRITVF